MIKKVVMSIILSLLITFGTVSPKIANATEKEINLATWGPPKHYISIQLAAWVEEVNANLAGKYKIVHYPGGQLYGPKDMHMAVAKGSVDMGSILQTRMLAMAPILQGAYLPFGFETLDDSANAYSGESLEIISKALEKKRIKPIFVCYSDAVQFFSNKKNINTVEDFKGQRLIATSPIAVEIFSNLGCAPDSSIPLTEQYMALKRGVSDGVLLSAVTGYFQKIYEVAPYVTNINLSYPVVIIAMNNLKWQKLPKETQEIMLSLGKKHSNITLTAAKAWTEKFRGALSEAGATVADFPTDERAKAVAVARRTWDQWANKQGKEAKKLMQLNIK